MKFEIVEKLCLLDETIGLCTIKIMFDSESLTVSGIYRPHYCSITHYFGAMERKLMSLGNIDCVIVMLCKALVIYKFSKIS